MYARGIIDTPTLPHLQFRGPGRYSVARVFDEIVANSSRKAAKFRVA